MNFKKFREKTKNLLILNKQTLRNLEKDENSLNLNLKYWIKTGKLLRLKKGVYITAEKWQKEENKDDYLEYLANRLLSPSYVSLEYVLSRYQLLTEATVNLTSVSTKIGRVFSSDLAGFKYYSISEKLFTGYELKKFKNADIFIAGKEKALFDFLYFRFRRKRADLDSIENLRINWENISPKELERAQKFCSLTNNKNIKEVFEIIKNKIINQYA